MTWHQSDFELRRSNSQQKSVNHFFSGFKALYLQTNPVAVQWFACCAAINHILDDSDVHPALCVTLSCTFYRQHKLNLCESSVDIYLSTVSHKPPLHCLHCLIQIKQERDFNDTMKKLVQSQWLQFSHRDVLRLYSKVRTCVIEWINTSHWLLR